MNPDPRSYWEKAGGVGYRHVMFRNGRVADHIERRVWSIALEFASGLGLEPGSCVIDLGCGDGTFVNDVLAHRFGTVDGIDLSEAGIRRAKANARMPRVTFRAADVTRIEAGQLAGYDGAFLMGILHHIKPQAAPFIGTLARSVRKIVVMEPNGSNLIRRLLEWTPAYRAAGEASFGTGELRRLFERAGYRCVLWRRVNLFPNFAPEPLLRWLASLEPVVEATPVLRALCSVNMYAFRIAEKLATNGR